MCDGLTKTALYVLVWLDFLSSLPVKAEEHQLSKDSLAGNYSLGDFLVEKFPCAAFFFSSVVISPAQLVQQLATLYSTMPLVDTPCPRCGSNIQQFVINLNCDFFMCASTNVRSTV